MYNKNRKGELKMKKLENAQKYLKISMLIVVISQLIPFIIENIKYILSDGFLFCYIIPMIVYFCANKKYKFAAIPSALLGIFFIVGSVYNLIFKANFEIWPLIFGVLGVLTLISSILYTIAVYKE